MYNIFLWWWCILTLLVLIFASFTGWKMRFAKLCKIFTFLVIFSVRSEVNILLLTVTHSSVAHLQTILIKDCSSFGKNQVKGLSSTNIIKIFMTVLARYDFFLQISAQDACCSDVPKLVVRFRHTCCKMSTVSLIQYQDYTDICVSYLVSTASIIIWVSWFLPCIRLCPSLP